MGDPPDQWWHGYTPFEMAVLHGFSSTARMLFRGSGYLAHSKEHTITTAANHGDSQGVRELLESDRNIALGGTSLLLHWL